MRQQRSQLLALALVVLIPSMMAPVIAMAHGSAPPDPLSLQAAVAAPLTAASPTGPPPAGHPVIGGRAPDVAAAGAAAAETAAAETAAAPRQWLRSVATAPMRPRLPGRASAARSAGQLSWNARLRIDEPAPDAMAKALATPGVRFATAAFHADMAVRTERGHTQLRVAFVDPGGFRVFTPRITGEARALWHAVGEGQALVTHHAARRLGLAPGDEIALADDRPITVIGAASLGRAHIADVVVSAHRVDRRRFDASSAVLVGVLRPRELDQTVARLEAAGVGVVRRVRDSRPYLAELTGDHGSTVAAFEPFAFVPGRPRGWITIDPGWVKRNIEKAQVPIIGEVVCHRLMIPQLRAALTEVQDSGLAPLLDVDDYGGCFAPRHIGRNPHSSLSMHAWGLAVDFNVHTNLMGHEPQLDPRIIEIFERHGFNWGGRWRTPDGMHFELGVLLEAS